MVDMPKGTYSTKNDARKNAKLIMRSTRCDAIKIESNKKNYKVIKDLTKNKIPVMGHIGYTPQFKKKFSVQGDTKKKSNKLLEEALLIEKAGAFSIVLECLTAKTSKLITGKLGLSGFYPKFVKKYTFLNRIIEKAVKKYTKEVKKVSFPSKKNFLNGTRAK